MKSEKFISKTLPMINVIDGEVSTEEVAKIKLEIKFILDG
jgi:hypothetical protein